MTLLSMDLQHLRKLTNLGQDMVRTPVMTNRPILGKDVMKKYSENERPQLRKNSRRLKLQLPLIFAHLLEKYLNQQRTQRGRMRLLELHLEVSSVALLELDLR